MSVTSFNNSVGGGLQPYEQIFTVSGTWTKPNGVKTAEVTVVGASGGVSNGNAPSPAGGYFKRIIDVSNMTSVAITVGAGGGQGSSGGSSSFGTITAPGSYSGGGSQTGSWYDTGKSGTSYWQNLGGGYTGMYGIWYGAVNSYEYAKSANNGRVYVYDNGNGQNATSDNGVGWSQMTGTNAYGPGKIVYGNGVYVRVEGSWSNAIQYSTNGANFSTVYVPGGYYKYGLTYGPQGFLIAANDGTVIKSPDGINWTQMSNFPTTGNAFLESTSTHYYLFVNGWSTAWRSTDGNAWESFSLPSGADNGNHFYHSRDNKVYYVYSNILYEISETTVTNKGGTYYRFTNAGSPVLVTNGGYQLVSTLGSTFTNANLGNYGIAVASTLGWIVAQSTGWGYSFSGTYAGFDGQAGTTNFVNNSTYYGSPGVTSVGGQAGNSVMANGGSGDIDGWGQGATYYNMAKTPGSGACSYPGNNGNPGIVRVRWWA